MKYITFLFLAFVLSMQSVCGQSMPPIKIIKTFHIASDGGWDYLAIGPSNKLYISHSTKVNILDKTSGDSLGVILNTNGVHGIAFDEANGKGYISNGRSNDVTVFDLKTDKEISRISTGENPDAIMYDSYSKMIITCNGRSKDLTVINPQTQKVVATIPVGGKPETAVSNEAGNWFVNIEDKNEIIEVNSKTFAVGKHWMLAPAEGPTGLAIDRSSKRLFAGCDKKLAVIDYTSGKVVITLPIGNGCDGVAFDDRTKTIFTSNGEGTITVIKELSADSYEVAGNVQTKRGARTITIDPATQILYLPASDLEKQQAAASGRPKSIPGSFQILVIK
ncbi:MAG: YncE family protein [Chitinophagaceae bacterium]